MILRMKISYLKDWRFDIVAKRNYQIFTILLFNDILPDLIAIDIRRGL